MPPLAAVDSVVCMGASIGMAVGVWKRRAASDFAQDDRRRDRRFSTFIHSGITGLVDVVYNQGHLHRASCVDNSTTGMTGHQHNPTTGFNVRGEIAPQLDRGQAAVRPSACRRVRVVDPFDMKASWSRPSREECRQGRCRPSSSPAAPARCSSRTRPSALRDQHGQVQKMRHVHEDRLPGHHQGGKTVRCRSIHRFAPAAACARRCAISARSKEASVNA